ncbi:hypothetical protein ACVDG5_025095 [Mesorhizobium sp. ORM6]
MSELPVTAPVDMAELRALFATAEGPLSFIAGGTDMLIAGRPLPADGPLVDLSRSGLGIHPCR